MSIEVSDVSTRRALLPWYIIEFLNSYACTTVLVCVPFYVQYQHNGTAAHSLLQMAGWGLMYVPFSLLSGKLADKWGPRSLLIRATAAGVPAFLTGLLAIYFPSLWLLFAVLILANFTNTPCWPALESAVARSPGRLSLSTRMSLYNLTWSSGGALAFAAADLVMGPTAYRHWPLIFIVPAVATLLSAILSATATIPQAMLSHTHVSDGHEDDDEAQRAATHLTPARAKSLLLMAWIGNTMAYVAGNVVIAVTPRMAQYAVHGSTWTSARIAGFALFFLWAGWHYRVRYMLAAYAVLIGTFFLMLITARAGEGAGGGDFGTPLPILIPAQIGFGLSAAFIYASSLYYAMHVSSGGGSHAGMHEALIGLGIALGCVVGAIATTTGSPTLAPVAYAVSTILLGGGIAIAVVAARGALKSRNVEPRV